MKTQPVQRFIDYVLLVLAVTVIFFPIFIMVLSAFKLERDIFSRTPRLFAIQPNLDNFRVAFQNPLFNTSIWNSILVTALTIGLTLTICLPAAYAYSRFRSAAVKRTALAMVAMRMFPPIIIVIPLFPVFDQLGMIDTPFVLVLLFVSFQIGMTTLLLKVFLDAIPRELDEAAMIDGCNRFQAFVRILMPIIRPGLIASAVFAALSSWNDYLFAFMFTNDRARTLPVAIAEILTTTEAYAHPSYTWPVVFAASTIQMIPMLLFVWYIQKTLLSGFTFGAVKG